ncbi:MAG: SDR family oxidoreductase [Planctomycetaceae bacterium]|nr:SDR family oxidoreductase [Planctomycetaceae bacterium]MBV8315002.1 SDR family oxidoreductase [Planctomycetaceae bacterium]
MMRLDGKVALITGASRGIGRAIAQRLGREGAAVVVNYSGNLEAARATVAAVEAAGGRAVPVQADVARVAEVERLFDETIRHLGRLDILVNNAGVMFNKPLAEVTEEEFDRIFAVNVKGTFFTCQQAARRMAEGGRMINLSSSTTALMLPTYASYVATKGAVEQLSHVLAKELGPRGITVNVVSPGPTDTELFGQGKTEQDKQRFAQMAALGRLGRPEDIADVVALLVSDEARWITGQNIRANGGLI